MNENEVEVGVALTEWGCEDLIPYFSKQEIDFATFQNLSEKDLINILPYGKVIKFMPIYERGVLELRKRKCVPSENGTLSTSTTTNTITPTPTSSIDLTSSERNRFDDDEENNNEQVPELKKLLNQTFPGKVLLASKSDDLSNEDRDRIAEIIICEELRKSTDKTIEAKRLVELANAVASTFTGESNIIYYSPHTKVGSSVFQAKGKFCTQMSTWRKRGIAVGIVSKLHNYKKPKLSNLSIDHPPDVNEAVEWLRLNIGPPDIATKNWKISLEYRIQFLEEEAGEIEKYLDTFKVLRQPQGLNLLLQDYNQNEKLKATSENFSLNWKKFAQRLIEKLTPKLLPTDELEELKLLFSEDHGVSVCHHFLLHLARIFPTPVVVKGRKPNHWTPTKAEIQLGFVGHYHSLEDFKTTIFNKAQRYSSFKKPLPFQPFAAIVGPNIRNVQKCYVVLQANDMYEVDSPFAAIDGTFKLIQVLDAKYPPESKLLWLTVQQAIYKIFTPSDKNIYSSQLMPLLKHFTKD